MKKAIIFFIVFAIFTFLAKAQMLSYVENGYIPTILISTTSSTSYNLPSNLINSNPSFSARDGANILEDEEGNWHLLGGWDSSGSLADNHYKSSDGGVTWIRQASVGYQARHTFGTEILNGFVYVFGSDYQAFGTNQNKGIWRADATDFTGWTEVQSNPPFGYDWVYGATQHNGYLYVMGGHPAGSSTNPSRLNRIFRSKDGINWTKLCSGCLPESGGMLTGHVSSFKGYLYLISISNYADSAADRVISSKVWRSSDDGVTWSYVSDIPNNATHYGNTFIIGDRMYFRSGWNPSEGNTARMYYTEDGVVWTEILNHQLGTSHASSINGIAGNIVQAAGNLFAEVREIDVIRTTNTTTTQSELLVTASIVSNPIQNGTAYSTGTHTFQITATNIDGSILSKGTEIPFIIEEVDGNGNVITKIASANGLIGENLQTTVTSDNNWIGSTNIGGNIQSKILNSKELQSGLNISFDKRNWANSNSANYDNGSYNANNGIYTSNAKRLKISIGNANVIMENFVDIITAQVGQSYSSGYWNFVDCSPHISPLSATSPYGTYTSFPGFQWGFDNIVDYYNWNQRSTAQSGTHINVGEFSNGMTSRGNMPQSEFTTFEIRHLGQWNSFNWEALPFTPVMGNQTPNFNTIHFDYAIYSNSGWNTNNLTTTVTNLATSQAQTQNYGLPKGSNAFRNAISPSNITILNKIGQRVKVESNITNELGTASIEFFYEIAPIY